MYAFGAQFAEVRVDADLGQIKVSRMVGCFGAGKILNAKTARSQFIGGMVWGISMALHETCRHGQAAGPLGEQQSCGIPCAGTMPTSARSKRFGWTRKTITSIRSARRASAKSELPGAAAAIANAVFHATGKRVRDLADHAG